MRIIKAKYPEVKSYGKPPQGFGSLYGGNHTANVQKVLRSDVIDVQHDSNWPK